MKVVLSKVAGVSHKNEDGSLRQNHIKKCFIGEKLILLPDPDNQYDPWAIKVLNSSNKQIGFIESRLAKDVWRHLDNGNKVEVIVKEVTGGSKEKPTRGVNIEIRIHDGSKSQKSTNAGCLTFIIGTIGIISILGINLI